MFLKRLRESIMMKIEWVFPDPLYFWWDRVLTRSNFIRLYVDGVEITQGWMGSGVVLYGDVNIDFVDHIEFYYADSFF